MPVFLFQIKEDGTLRAIKECPTSELPTPESEIEIPVDAPDVYEALYELVQAGVLRDMY